MKITLWSADFDVTDQQLIDSISSMTDSANHVIIPQFTFKSDEPNPVPVSNTNTNRKQFAERMLDFFSAIECFDVQVVSVTQVHDKLIFRNDTDNRSYDLHIDMCPECRRPFKDQHGRCWNHHITNCPMSIIQEIQNS